MIDVLDRDFEAYGSPFIQIVYCCDATETFDAILFYKDVGEHEHYYLVGENPRNEFIYALDGLTDEVVLLDNTDHSVYQKVASDDYFVLDALLEAATLFRKDVFDKGRITGADRMAVAISCAQLAGIPDEPQFWIEFVGA